jgi:DNA-binding LacI/PurR family transcriptional regulator
LSGAVGQPSDELVAETLRRHVPVVVMGACGGEAKLNAIAPDYTDAGFRLCEHLYRVGCRTVVILRSELTGREAALVVGGCQAAAVRWGRRVTEVSLAPAADPEGPLQDLENRLVEHESLDGPESGGRGQVAGLVCIGARALEVAILDERLAGLRRARRVAITSVSEPGDGAAEAAGITSYEVASGQIAGWAARLLAGTRPGQRPVEVIIPGTVRVRGQSRSDDVRIRDNHERSGPEPPWSNREVLSGTII